MSSLRKLRAWAFNHELNPDKIRAQLSASAVPVSSADCRTCSDPCEDGHGDYPARFTIDMETQMLGTVRAFRRQILISTGTTDWDLEPTRTNGSLAAHVFGAHRRTAITRSTSNVPYISGIFNASDSCQISILNGSHKTISDDPDLETVLVFPDFMIVAGVPSSSEGGKTLWNAALDPRIPRILGSIENNFSTWVLPYSVVITFCSHKRRDGRCGLSAPKLERAFTNSLLQRGWTVDTQLEHIIDPPLEKFPGTAEEKDTHVAQALKSLQTAKKALVLFNSHMGDHQYTGNCIIYTPNGASVWYGRITPHEVDSVVENTVEGGLVLPALLRGGLNLSKPGCKTLHDW
ncbi:Sucrase/ferredoxin-like-domain-containing protein [Mycena albidolilacea]|uniref:Sucrase/ferredoxin-like-domain-containing protein n=1 Tax=Mycena albidolilacea TaxID=1033008 RepID=A0AAD7AIN1_9AGAR|nr:Sucrase/ferredoxin-like-domain-containing protein [Mycena albidolilacea]